MKQITNNTNDNWNIFQDEKGTFWSIAQKEGCQDSYFCRNIKHIISLIYNYKAYSISDFTEYGLSLIDEYLILHHYTRLDLFGKIA